MSRLTRFAVIASLLVIHGSSFAQREKTAFQVADAWSEDYDVRSDVAIVYGINDAGGNFKERVKSWRDKGYAVHFMTGIAWGQYQDYFLGKYDGKTHWDEGQVMRNGDTIWHGHNVPYINPSANYLKYMKSHVKEAIDAGVTAIHLEEPEYWARAGYSSSFKNEWKNFYGQEWRPQHESPDATYLSNKLKYQLYYNALKEVFNYVKLYSESKGKRVRCYVPTHSLLNYSSWHIVSPEASLASLPGMDGYIAQIWTGTSREPVHFNGIAKERVFENAFLECGSMVSMTAPTGRKIFFLTDPIEDRVKTWDDHKRNYQATYTAQLLYPMVADYEVMPWPPRIYRGKYRIEGTDKREGISAAYATQMQVMVNALNDMPLSDEKVSGSQCIEVLVSNTMMFQNHPTHADYDDPYLANFYGMAMPLLKRGVPVGTVHMENLSNPNALKNTKVLVMSYANMKPHDVMVHEQLAAWVRKGGVLVYYGRDNDAFQQVTEWWNTKGNTFKTASQHLFKTLGIGEMPADTVFGIGKGFVYRVTRDPKELVMKTNGDKGFIDLITDAYQRSGADRVQYKNNFILNRGPYLVAAVLDEGDTDPLEIGGQFIDLFDPALPVLPAVKLLPGQQGVYYRIPAFGENSKAKVFAAAARVTGEKHKTGSYQFMVKSPSHTQNIMRIALPVQPENITVTRSSQPVQVTKNEWHAASHTLLLGFENYSEGVHVKIEW